MLTTDTLEESAQTGSERSSHRRKEYSARHRPGWGVHVTEADESWDWTHAEKDRDHNPGSSSE